MDGGEKESFQIVYLLNGHFQSLFTALLQLLLILLWKKFEKHQINPTTINEWIRKYNRKDLMNTRIKVETKDEITRIKALQKEIEQLKKLLLKKTEIDKINIKTALLIGGEAMQKQLRQLGNRSRIIVGTPGRINDHLKRKSLNLSATKYLVLDETDRMLDMGLSLIHI